MDIDLDPSSAGIDFWRQNLTSKVDPRTEWNIYYDPRPIKYVFK